jgi:hypothetical protein
MTIPRPGITGLRPSPPRMRPSRAPAQISPSGRGPSRAPRMSPSRTPPRMRLSRAPKMSPPGRSPRRSPQAATPAYSRTPTKRGGRPAPTSGSVRRRGNLDCLPHRTRSRSLRSTALSSPPASTSKRAPTAASPVWNRAPDLRRSAWGRWRGPSGLFSSRLDREPFAHGCPDALASELGALGRQARGHQSQGRTLRGIPIAGEPADRLDPGLRQKSGSAVGIACDRYKERRHGREAIRETSCRESVAPSSFG